MDLPFAAMYAGATLVIAAPSITFLVLWEMRERRENKGGPDFWEMEAGKTYRIERRGAHWITGEFARYEDDRAVFANHAYIRRQIDDDVRVLPL